MERKRRTRQRIELSFAAVSCSLSVDLTRSRSFILFFTMFMLLPIYLSGQARVVCSGNVASFEEYEPIAYPVFPRRAGVYGSFDFDLAVLPGGKFDYKLLNPANKHTVAYELHESVIKSFSGWRFVNRTDKTIALKLDIMFELSGRVQAQDDIVKNKITINQNVVTINVIATQIIPRLTE
jgi:hypothetical protein